MSVRIISFTQFSLYCKYVLRKHFPQGYKHLRTRVDTKQQEGRTVSVLVINTGAQEVILSETLDEWYEKYQRSLTLREITDAMVIQCVQLVDKM